MSWLLAMVVGGGTALACFSGLWWTVRATLRTARGPFLVAGSGLLRLALATAAFYALSREGGVHVLAGFAGFWLVRMVLVVWLGGFARVTD